MKCKYCQEKEKNWNKGNSEIRCAFEGDEFSPDNWNCGSTDYLRERAENNELWNNDQFAGIVPYSVDDEQNEGFLYLEWYKHRGTTEKCIDMETMKPVSKDLAYKIIEQRK